MIRLGRRLALLSLLLGPLVGCGSQPIPTIAVAGTTVTIAIPTNYPTGFGRAIGDDPGNPSAWDPASPFEDFQRGELKFKLVDPSGLQPDVWLPVRLVTRVNVDGVSPASVDPGSVLKYHAGQKLAFLDIPATVPAGSYRIEVYRYRRDAADPTAPPELVAQAQTTTGADWLGWGDGTSPLGIPISILSGDQLGHFTPWTGWLDVLGAGLTGWAVSQTDVAELVPYPEFDVSVRDQGDPSVHPAAWELEVAYPKDRLRIRGVTLLRQNPSGALVSWEADDPDVAVTCGDDQGVLRIQLVDPERATDGVRVAYDLRNLDTVPPLCGGGRAVASDVAVEAPTFRAYDEDGVEITASSTYVVSGPAGAS